MFDEYQLILVAVIGSFCLLIGIYIGALLCVHICKKRMQAEEQEEKQQQMWNDYLKALGGQYGK
jgi:hypothetical protein